MKVFKDISHVFFIGIGGIGMSALARYFAQKDKQVAGYDKTPSPLTEALLSEGIESNFEAGIDAVPKEFLNPNSTLVVYTPAISASNALITYFKKNNYCLKKRAEVLGIISEDIPVLGVAGTHGKTTTTAILAHLLKAAEVKLTAFLGGVSENYHTNFLYEGDEVIVAEADEFDRSFLQLSPKMAAITSMDSDHLDIYGEAGTLKKSFEQFANSVPNKDDLFIRKGLPLKGRTFGIEEDSDFYATNISLIKGAYNFDLQTPTSKIEGLDFILPGRHNLLNAVAALSMAYSYGVSEKDLKKGLMEFKGVERRFSYRLKSEDCTLIDDYAHHPTEIDAVFQALREMYPDTKLLAVFQPHLYSRTQDFIDDFVKSLNHFDEILLLDIYPAREEPIAGINSKLLIEKIISLGKHTPKTARLIKKEEVADAIIEASCPVSVMMGAGDIGKEVDTVVKKLKKKSSEKNGLNRQI